MRIAVTGVSGFIGSYIARRLRQDGHQVNGLVRASSRTDHIRDVVDRLVVGDQTDRASWPRFLDGADVLVHNSLDRASPEEQFEAYLQRNLVASLELLVASAPRRFVYVSSVAAISQVLPRWQGLITADHPPRPSSRYGALKAAVEAFLWSEHLGKGRAVSIIRPSAVYGMEATVSDSHGYDIVQSLRTTRRYAQAGGGKFVHVEDVAAVVSRCCTQDRGNGGVFNLADCYARWGDWATMAAAALGITDATIDLSSPPHPKNQFDKTPVRELGVDLNRGHAGIRQHLKQLIAAMKV